jgi:hypothetical protein
MDQENIESSQDGNNIMPMSHEVERDVFREDIWEA